jgi:hypothetical protein
LKIVPSFAMPPPLLHALFTRFPQLGVSGNCKRYGPFSSRTLCDAAVKLWVSSTPDLIQAKNTPKISGLKNGPGLYIAFNSWL